MDNYIISQTGGVLSSVEHEQTKIAIRAAKREGKKFIELYYNQNLVQDAVAQSEIRINGVRSIRVYQHRDAKNRVQYEVVETGGQCVFQLDEISGEWIGEMLDDQEDGLYGEKGYNRDFLASHFETGEFIIKDKRIERDIKRRLDRIKKAQHEKELAQIESDAAILPVLEEEQARIKEKIAKAKELQVKAKTEAMPSLTTFKKSNPPLAPAESNPKPAEANAKHATSS